MLYCKQVVLLLVISLIRRLFMRKSDNSSSGYHCRGRSQKDTGHPAKCPEKGAHTTCRRPLAGWVAKTMTAPPLWKWHAPITGPRTRPAFTPVACTSSRKSRLPIMSSTKWRVRWISPLLRCSNFKRREQYSLLLTPFTLLLYLLPLWGCLAPSAAC